MGKSQTLAFRLRWYGGAAKKMMPYPIEMERCEGFLAREPAHACPLRADDSLQT